MKFGPELEEKLKRLEGFLEGEIEKINKNVKREYSFARLISEAPGVAIIETELDVNTGELVGIHNLKDDPESIGFVVKKFERMGKNYCIVNTKSVGYGELPEVFHICKVDFLYALTRRLEAVKNELHNFIISTFLRNFRSSKTSIWMEFCLTSL